MRVVYLVAIALAALVSCPDPISAQKYSGVWSQWSDYGACKRPESCPGDRTCCNEYKGYKYSYRKCTPTGSCNPSKGTVRERQCIIKCVKYDKLSRWKTDKVCRRPATGACAAEYSCCKQKKGLKTFTRRCLGDNCDPNEPLKKVVKCTIKCQKKIECVNDLKDPRAFVDRTCDGTYVAGQKSLLGTTCEYTCPRGFNVFPFSETTCAMKKKSRKKAFWQPMRSPCCVADECQTDKKLDLLFLLDTSLSIADNNCPGCWGSLKQGLKTLIGGGQFKIGKNDVRIAVTQFNQFILPREHYLKNTTTKAALMDHIDSLECCAYGTNVGMALGHMHDNHFSREMGNRRGVPNVLVVVTDGATTDGFDVLKRNAEKTRNHASLWSVQIGRDTNPRRQAKIEKTLSIIAGPDTPNNRLIIDSFGEIQNIVQELSEKISKSSCNACTNKDDRAQWSPWAAGECDSACGEGTVTYTRTCEGVGECEGTQTEKKEPCEDLPACAQWTEWEGQGCEEPCGEGKLETFTRECVGVGDCPGDDTKQEACEGNPACAEWTEWVEGECSVDCGKGVAKYTRTCEGWPVGGCPGEAEKEEVCERDPCPACEQPKTPYKGQLSCVRKDKSRIMAMARGIIPPYPAGSQCTFTCGEGLVITPEGSDVLTCGTDSEWNKPVPCCKLPQCSVTEFMDLIIIVDKSVSNRREGWLANINFLLKFLSRSINIGPDNVRVGIILFAEFVDKQRQIHLKDTTNQATLLNQVRAMRDLELESRTFTPRAMRHAADEMLKPENGNRELAPNLFLVLTDGEPTEGKKEFEAQGYTGDDLRWQMVGKLVEASVYLRTKGTVFGIGVGIGKRNTIAQTAIKEIGGLKEFPNNHAFVNDHSELEEKAAQLEASVMDAGCEACVTPQAMQMLAQMNEEE